MDIPKRKQKPHSGRPKSGSLRKTLCSSSPDKCFRQRKRSNSDNIPPSIPLERDGIQLGSLMAQEAARSFWNSEMLESSLRKLHEYATQTIEQANNTDKDNDKNDTSSSTEAEELDNLNVEEIYTLDEDTCTSTSEDLLGKSDTALTSDDLLEKSDTALTSDDLLGKSDTALTSDDLLGKSDTALTSDELLEKSVTVLTSEDLFGKSDTALTTGNKSSALSSSLNLHSVLTTLHSLSDHQLELRPKRHVVYSSSMRRAHTDPCLSPRLMRLRQVSSLCAGTLEVCR